MASLGIPPRLQHFLPGHAAALKRIDAIDPAQYARSRNALDGAVT
ncbi:MAG: deoxyribodipyrimidine photolyase, partial [Chitinophagaceae bacterium]|nr:deoxyribodipyrimidine photolyase [Polaromonas sp.]